MPELPPPPPPPLSLGAALLDALSRHRPPWATRKAGIAIGAVLLVLVAMSALLSWQARRLPPPEVYLPRVGATDGGGVAGAGAGVERPEPDDGQQPVAVHAAGAFARPGLYELPAGSRVADLVDAAGGPAADAVVDALNLAAKLSDGERIYMPRRGEPVDVAVASGAGAGGADAGENAVIDLNTATLEQLDSLTGIGPSTAQAILDHRREHGRFRSVEELLEVRGIGEAKLASIRSRVRV